MSFSRDDYRSCCGCVPPTASYHSEKPSFCDATFYRILQLRSVEETVRVVARMSENTGSSECASSLITTSDLRINAGSRLDRIAVAMILLASVRAH